MKDRKKQRENRKLKHKEEMIDKHNRFGNKDLTPYNAVLQMRMKDKAAIALKYLAAQGTVDEKVLKALKNKANLAKTLVDDYRYGNNPFM